MALSVLKNNGASEEWSQEKIKSSILHSGASVEEADAVSALIEIWAQRFAENGVVKAHDIRAKIIEIMKAVNSAFSQAYEEYRKVR